MRERMVTRTVTATKATALCLNVTTSEPSNETLTLSGVFKNDKAKMLKAFQSVYDTEENKAVAIVAYEEIETLYGMTEQEFIKYAKELPPRKAGETDTETSVN